MSNKKNSKTAPSSTPTPSKKLTNSKKGIVKHGNAGSTKSTEESVQRSSIFGDWTGKTPVSLLHEHCQKSNWEKPEFEIKKKKNGYLGTVQLSQRNKKTAQMQTVAFTPPDELVLPSAAEAKHLAATYALHRVKSHMPLQRVLPPTHRDYWRQFEQLKTASNQWQYDPDPFNAHPPMTAQKKSRSLPTKEHAASAVPMPTTATTNSSKRPLLDEKLLKEWENLPTVHMSLENRQRVEEIIKRSKITYQPLPREHTKQERMHLTKELVAMGFRPAHVDEALDYSPDKETALDWLCLHVPEDDLPANFLLSTYNPTMTTIAHTTQTLGQDWLLKRMAAIGYPESICKEALEQVQGDESKALKLLQWRLAHEDETMPSLDPVDLEELEAVRQDEVIALESIYGSLNQETDKDGRRIYSLPFNVSAPEQPVLQVIIPKESMYPFELPLFVIEWPNLPSYLKLSLLQGLMAEAELHLGMPFVYMCVEWLQEHADHMIAHPPKLRDVSERLYTLAPTTPVQKKNKSRRQIHQKPTTSLDSLKEQLLNRLESEAYAPMAEVRSKLPAHQFKSNVIHAVLAHQVTIVSGETGCGKTTQVPQFIMDEEIMQGRYCNMICTQPRKISAIGVAERVAAERCETIGKTVGYAIRGETKCSAETRLQFVTTGVLLRRLQSDPNLEGVSHVMIDEVHERSVDSDFLLVLLRKVLQRRKDLKVVLMSATLNQALFSDYFGGAPVIEIPGFTHPVQDYFLEDILSMVHGQAKTSHNEDVISKPDWATWQIPYLEQGFSESTVRLLSRYRNHQKIDYGLVARLVKYITDHETIQDFKPAILIFMPGAVEIKTCIDAIEEVMQGTEAEILPLHANLSPQEQTRVFRPVPSHVRKIVVATNVAETSITIEGVVYVIDSGRVKETQYEAASHMVHLVETWASRASCRQRRGRAGRTRPGQCFKLFTRETHEQKMRAQQVPELLRTPLEQLCLVLKAMGQDDLVSFLRQAIDPPSMTALESAIKSLRQVEAIDKQDQLTALGKHMAAIPADLRISKMLIYGSVFGCLDPILTIASIMSLKSPFTSPMEKRVEAREAREKFNFGKSDWLADMKAYDSWYEIIRSKGMKAARTFCQENFLSFSTLSEIQNLRRQYLEALAEIGFYKESARFNDNADNVNLVKSVIFAGLNPNVVKIKLPDTKYDKVLSGTVEREKEAREIKYYTKDDGRVFIHPSSLLFSNNSYQSLFLTYFSKMTTSKIFIRDGTEVPLYGILFFGGSIKVDHLGRGLRVGDDGWIKLRSWARIGVLVNQLKRLLSLELYYKIEDPDREVSVAHAIIALITNDGMI
ncbi:P-loop containing nucleoside triphosphate hydrolase protein [Rhizopus microsporus ATCC 52813]|uniref:RNA helicase n=1 Tax=Rhizopus microsporus ATCC 52813 TaxID=1340429 RepID=A0A2G4T3I5_RHIZD|nr:P-loop containing nucleoside triphosphate hydrolase protein [Rhizopus microsporus ATCC 52813]PHZ15236.1 P-loop containing nucleoside triphosphate hydrolase protein [Rhizopus microsporus ATCC 52813]